MYKIRIVLASLIEKIGSIGPDQDDPGRLDSGRVDPHSMRAEFYTHAIAGRQRHTRVIV